MAGVVNIPHKFPHSVLRFWAWCTMLWKELNILVVSSVLPLSHVVREMRSPNLFFFLDNKLSLQCIQILDAVSCPRPRPLPLPSPVCSMSDPAAPTTNMYPRGMNPRLRYIKSYWWPYKTFVKQRYASALSVPTAL